jgi:hypothetical protein
MPDIHAAIAGRKLTAKRSTLTNPRRLVNQVKEQLKIENHQH